LAFDVVQVPNATSLQLLADATDTTVDYVRALNPHLKRDITPRGEAYNVNVPAGRSKQLVALLKRIPGDRRETARIISVVPGEDLQSVANRTGISVSQLQAMNSGVDLKSVTKLVVPNNNVRLTRWTRSSKANSTAPGLTKIRARKGDTISKIATARKLDVNEIAKLNGLTPNTKLRAGQEIRLPVTAAAAPSGRR